MTESPSNPAVPDPRSAVVFVAAVAVLFFWGGVAMQIVLGRIGLPVAQWLFFFLPSVLYVRHQGYDPVATLSLRPPTTLGVGGALCLIVGVLPIVWLIGWLQTFIVPIPVELLEGLERMVTAQSMGGFVWLLLAVVLTPAVCEEIVFRGVLLGGTRGLSPWRMIALNGVIFGLFHLSVESLIRFLPTATLGIVIAWAVWRTGSLWVGVLMHLVNNGAIVVLASTPGLREMFSDPRAPPPLWSIPLALIVFAIGARILQGHEPPTSRSARNTPHEEP